MERFLFEFRLFRDFLTCHCNLLLRVSIDMLNDLITAFLLILKFLKLFLLLCDCAYDFADVDICEHFNLLLLCLQLCHSFDVLFFVIQQLFTLRPLRVQFIL
jgi:hypothetical protein